jgi:uncharacterized protein YfaS (alpha-2-macroglobulin family)
VTVGLPAVSSTTPRNGESGTGRFGVRINFATPMDPATLEGKLSISGFTADDLVGKIFADERGISASVPLDPSASYSVVLAAGGQDRYGQPMGEHRFSFQTGALPSSISLSLAGFQPGVLYSASAEPILYFQATNTPTARFSLYPLSAAEARPYLHDYGQVPQKFTPAQPTLREWAVNVTGGKDQVSLGSTSLSGGGPLPKGYYFVRSNGQYRSEFAFAVTDTEIVTKLSTNELVAWVIDHDTGRPIGGATIHASGAGVSPAEAVTDGNGLATFQVPVPLPGKNFDRAYYVTLEGDGRLGLASTRWSQGVSPFQFNLPAEYFARQWVGQLYTDRPIYRPGETVDFRGVVRADDDAHYSVPTADPGLEFVITNARGQLVQKDDVRLNEFGTFAGTFELPADAPLGDYMVNVKSKGSDPSSQFTIFANSFRVAEFRKPEFQVQVSPDRSSYLDGDQMRVQASATYFFGGPVAGAPVQWSAQGSPYAMQVKGYERYSFTDYDYWRQPARKDPIRSSGNAVTGPDGTATFTIPAAIPAADGPQQFTLSATLTDQSAQAVAASTAVIVHPAALYAGVRPAQYLATQGTNAKIDVVSVDTEGRPVPAREVLVRIYERQWVTSKQQTIGGGRLYVSEPRDTLIVTRSTTTDAKGEGSVSFTPTKPGTLRLVTEISDERGRVSHAAGYLWVAGSGFASWQVTNDDGIALIADKDRYEVGETADILVPAPFAGAIGLVTIERGKLITRSVREFPTNSERLRIPITDGSVPNVFVSVVLYRPPTTADPVPRYKVGYVQLKVSTASRSLAVKVRADRELAKPGDSVRYDISVTDLVGKGVRSDVSIAVVDKAVLSLEDERGPDGLHAFWFERGLAVTTASSISVSMDRANDVISEAPRQGKGGSGSGLGEDRLRKDFRNTAYWSGQVITAEDGTASVTVVMPDNLTTWRMQVRAVSGDTMVGEGTNELISTRPLLLRPALPRFLRVGDRTELRALVRNGTATATDVTVGLRAEGVVVSGGTQRTATVAAGASVLLSWPARVESEGTAKLTFTAAGTGGLSDSVVQQLPVLLDMTPETTATGGIVTNDPGVEAVYLPPFADQAHGSLSVSIQSALVGSMADELSAFAPQPFEGAQAVAGRLIATLGVRRAEKSARGTSAAYDSRIASDLAGLVGRQRSDGGWAWCDPQCPTDPHVTSWVLLALGEARRDGLAIDPGVLLRAAPYLASYLGRVTDVANPADPSDKALVLAGLSSIGGQALTSARALFEQERTRLTSWGRAYLLLALADAGAPADDPQIRSLLNDLAATTLASANGNHWEDGAVRGSFMTNTATTGLVALALGRVQPGHPLLAQTVRWLVFARAADGWRTQADRALAVSALTAYVVKTGELAGDYDYRVALGSRALLSGSVRATEAPKTATTSIPLTALSRGQPNLIAFTRDYAQPGRLYYTMNLRYVTPAKEIEALNRGFAISRKYTALDDPARAITTVKLGDTVRVTITVVAPADRKYVSIEDLLPAGLEPIDARLKTTDPQLRARLEADRVAASHTPAGAFITPWSRWYYSPWQSVELRDDRTTLMTDRLSKGVYEYVYYVRATAPGDFFVAPAHAEETNFPEVFGRSDSGRFVVTP